MSLCSFVFLSLCFFVPWMDLVLDLSWFCLMGGDSWVCVLIFWSTVFILSICCVWFWIFWVYLYYEYVVFNFEFSKFVFDFEFFGCVCIVSMLCLILNFLDLYLILNFFLGLCLILNFWGKKNPEFFFKPIEKRSYRSAG